MGNKGIKYLNELQIRVPYLSEDFEF